MYRVILKQIGGGRFGVGWCWLGVGSQNLVLALCASTPQPAVVRSRSNLVHSMAHIGPLRMLNLSRIGGGFI